MRRLGDVEDRSLTAAALKPQGTACYLYCLTPSGTGARNSTIGVDGQHPASLLECGGIGAVLNEVSLNDFSGEAAEAHLRDLAWLAPRVFRHEAVIEEVMSGTPVLPAGFATLFASGGSLQQFVSQHRDSIAEFFNRLGDKQEWGVKGVLDPRRPGRSASPSSSGGAGYLRKKRIEASAERDFRSRLKEFCRRAATELGDLAGEFRERRILPPANDVTGPEILLNWAFLVSPAAIGDFRAVLERFNRDEAFPGLSFALTGPWPPYSFAPNLS